eukprot:TRINITY_DN3369_c0_g3_i2.p1 TRINITY_DN3369_c0_g3~~TRINITY_DN3369_c0_g3_i2.p1  ORF type:complete len:290 (-),score=6.02 TRINITY_DN3369_c0_g3_i2:349-1218(-)
MLSALVSRASFGLSKRCSHFLLGQNNALSGYSTLTQAKVLRHHEFGAPESVLRVETEDLPAEVFGSEVLVKMLAAPINPADENMIAGTYGFRPALPAVGGNEGCGLVLAVGPSAARCGLAPGDRVIFTQPGVGTWRTAGVFDASQLAVVPSDIAIEYSAMISVTAMSAFRMLQDFVELRPGDAVIQNAATSAVGKCIIALAAERGVSTINVIRSRPDPTDVMRRLRTIGSKSGCVVITEDFFPTPECQRMLASELPAPKLGLNAVGGQSAVELIRALERLAVAILPKVD